jgi:peptide/nickel transport system ATP-binding protein
VGVLDAGQIVEEGTTADTLLRPANPYTIGLMSAIPSTSGPRRRLAAISGNLPDLRSLPPGCAFEPRCPWAAPACAETPPALERLGEDRGSRCHFNGRLDPHRGFTNRRETLLLPEAEPGTPALAISGLGKTFRSGGLVRLFGGHSVRALDGLSFEIPRGGTVAVVGESGSGKSTLARCVGGLIAPDTGNMRLDGALLAGAVSRRPRIEQRRIQFVFQNPDASLNPHHTVEDILSRPLILYGSSDGPRMRTRVEELLDMVKLGRRYADRYPQELSGGQKQRVAIARALAAEPELVICDEPTSALDISVQAAILNELIDLQGRLGVSYLFISHDLGVVRYVSDYVLVLHRGRLVEEGTSEQVLTAPRHAYTQSLVSAVPSIEQLRREVAARQ